MKFRLLDVGRLEYDEGLPLVGGGVSTASESSPPVGAAHRREEFYD